MSLDFLAPGRNILGTPGEEEAMALLQHSLSMQVTRSLSSCPVL